MKTSTKPTGAISTRDAWASGGRIGRDIQKLDANDDGVITKAEVAAGEKQLKMDAAERKMIGKVLAHAQPERNGVSRWSATIYAPYIAEHLASADAKSTGTVRAKDLSKLTFPAGEGKFGVDRVATELAADMFEYVQAEEKAGKKI